MLADLYVSIFNTNIYINFHVDPVAARRPVVAELELQWWKEAINRGPAYKQTHLDRFGQWARQSSKVAGL